MKVYIGPYSGDKLNPHRWVAKLREWKILRPEREDLEDDVWDKLAWRALPWVDKLINKPFARFFDRNVKVTIHGYDTWCAEYTLALVIYPLLVELRKHKQGSPNVDDADVPENIRSTSAPEMNADRKAIGDVDDFYHARWEWVLNEMIWAFEQLAVDWEVKFYNETAEDDPEYMVKYEAIQNRISNGLVLFGKYYQGLWT